MKNWRFGTKVVLSIEILADRICILGSQNSRYAKLESNIIENYTWYKNLGKSQKKLVNTARTKLTRGKKQLYIGNITLPQIIFIRQDTN